MGGIGNVSAMRHFLNKPTPIWGLWMKGTAMKKDAVLVDIDGTLVGITEFDYSVFSKGDDVVREYLKEWDARTMMAQVYERGVQRMMEFKKQGYVVVVVTARGQSCKGYTNKKFREMGIHNVVDSVWHRPLAWEGKSSALYKEWMIKKLSKKFNFVYAMEDEEKNMEVMEKAGMEVVDARVWW